MATSYQPMSPTPGQSVMVQPVQPMQPVMVGQPAPQPSTTVVSVAPSTFGLMIQNWNTGIFDCFGDLGVCAQSCFCPCLVYGQNERLMITNGADNSTDAGQATMCCCASFWGNLLLAFIGCPGVVHTFFICSQRKRFRERAGIIGGDCEDAVCACCCHGCVLGQIYLEETRFKVLSKNAAIMAAGPQPMMMGGPQVTVVQTTQSGAPQPVYAAQPMPMQYGQPMYVQPPAQYGQPVQYGQPPVGQPQPYYAQAPAQALPSGPQQPPAYGQPQPLYYQPTTQ